METNPCRSGNFFLEDIQLYSGGTNQVGALVMITGTSVERAIDILKNKHLRRFIKLKVNYGIEYMKPLLDFMIK